MTDLTERLRECPFCGGEAKLVSGTSSTVQCQNDQCIIGDAAPFNDFSHRQDAIAAWNKRPTLETLTQENARLREALGKVERWELPETGRFWENADGTISDRPMGYEVCYGSNGAQDYMRSVARKALGGGDES